MLTAVLLLLSVIFNSNSYTPSSSPEADVTEAEGSEMVPAVGPDTFVHKYFVIKPAAAVEAVPSRVTVFWGSVMDPLFPALATGCKISGLTLTVTTAVALFPLLSVTVNSKLYSPATSAVTSVTALDVLLIIAEAGPDIFFHA